jgi:hypothetical protein
MNKKLNKKSEQLFNKEWIISYQYALLEDLILGRNNKFSLAQNCTKYALIDSKTQFIESYKQFGHNDYYVCEFLKSVRENTKNLAKSLIKSEKITSIGQQQFINGVDNQHFSTNKLLKIVFHCLYGNCVLIQDEFYCLQLMKNLMEIQFRTEDLNAQLDLRRLIRRQSCSFNILFKLYMTFSHSSQLFLTAALYEPITKILNDEWYLDIDPDKALARFSQDDILNKFGHPSTKEYKLKTQKYREKILNSLHAVTTSFIESLSSSMFCFPASLSWLVNQLYQIVNKNLNTKMNQDVRKYIFLTHKLIKNDQKIFFFLKDG